MKTGIIILKEEANVTLTYYLNDESPELSNAVTRPAMLVLPGGAYRMCSDREAEPIALAYLAEGFQTFVLRYTVGNSGEFETVLKDAEAAMEMIYQHAEEWKVDCKRIAAIGFSAGGHLAAMLGTTGMIKPGALVLGYPCIQEIADSAGGILPFPIPNAAEQVSKNTPPTFMFAASDDQIVPVDSLPFANALHQAQVPFELHIFQKGGHGLSLAKRHTANGKMDMVEPRVARWFAMSVEWLNDIFDNFPVEEQEQVLGMSTELEEYGVDVALGVLWENEECSKLLSEYLPQLDEVGNENIRKTVIGISLRMMAEYQPEILTKDTLGILDNKLKSIPIKGKEQ